MLVALLVGWFVVGAIIATHVHSTPREPYDVTPPPWLGICLFGYGSLIITLITYGVEGAVALNDHIEKRLHARARARQEARLRRDAALRQLERELEQ